jgi:D-beta-D-heptose 7-phosphate kinase/D-beta-D-heptose 1-phosphate adenosyltransferase
MKNLFKKISGTGILIIGDIMADQFIWGNVERISPEAPVPVVEVTKENFLLGGAANVAHNIASLGGRVFITGVVGYDDMGNTLKKNLLEKGIPTDGILEEHDRATTVKTRIYAHDQQVVRFDKETKYEISKSIRSRMLDYVRSCLPRVKAIILSDYCKGVVTKNLLKKLLELTASKVFISVDPKIGHFDFYKGAHFITPNVHEASYGSGIKIIDELTLKKAGNALLSRFRTRAILITRGDKGMTLFEKGGRITHIPTLAKEVYDVTGAGDTVIAAFTLYHASGADLTEAADFANHAAGIVVGERGTAVVTREEISESYRLNRRVRE